MQKQAKKKKSSLIKTSLPASRLAKPLSPRKKIVVVDDDPAIGDVLSIIFTDAGYTVEVMAEGTDILTTDYIIPDLFLIDKLLSGINGLDLCRHLKTKSETAQIPVIMISASPGISLQACEAGADDYIEKPFDLDCLLKLIERHLNKDRISPVR